MKSERGRGQPGAETQKWVFLTVSKKQASETMGLPLGSHALVPVASLPKQTPSQALPRLGTFPKCVAL